MQYFRFIACSLLACAVHAATPTNVAVTTSLNPSRFGQPVTLFAAVTPANASGNVVFYDASTLLGSASISYGQATFTTGLLGPGVHLLTAQYLGDGSYSAANSPGLFQTVGSVQSNAPSVVIESPPSPAMTAYSDELIQGWAIDNIATTGSAITSVQVIVDGNNLGDATYGLSRPEVCAAYPGRPGCPNVGFQFALNTGNLALGSIHTLTVNATNSNGTTGSETINFAIAPPAATENSSKIGIFRNTRAFLEDSNGNQFYDSGADRFFNTFAPPGGTQAGDVGVAGDWSGDGRSKAGIYRPSTGQWFLDANNDGVYDAGDLTYNFGGIAGDVPVVGDWSGYYKSCVGIFRQGAFWLLDLNCNGTFDGTPTDAFFPFGGVPGDAPVVGAWTGNKTRVGVVRPYTPNGQPFLWVFDSADTNAGDNPGNHQPVAGNFAFGGAAGDLYVAGDWGGTGFFRAGIYRHGFWLLDLGLNGISNHTYDTFSGFGGLTTDTPVVGRW